MRRQHLDANGVEYGMLMQLEPRRHGGAQSRLRRRAVARRQRLAARGRSSKPEPRLRAGIVVPQEDAAFAVSEIERRANDPALRPDPDLAARQRSARPSPLLADLRGGAALPAADCAACAGLQRRPRLDRVGLADLLHAGALRHYDRHAEHASRAWCSRACSSAFPSSKVVLIEGGFTWAPALCWRMDKHWQRMRKETPHLKRPPSEYVRDALLVHHPADRGAGGSRSISPTSSPGSAGTG